MIDQVGMTVCDDAFGFICCVLSCVFSFWPHEDRSVAFASSLSPSASDAEYVSRGMIASGDRQLDGHGTDIVGYGCMDGPKGRYEHIATWMVWSPVTSVGSAMGFIAGEQLRVGARTKTSVQGRSGLFLFTIIVNCSIMLSLFD